MILENYCYLVVTFYMQISNHLFICFWHVFQHREQRTVQKGPYDVTSMTIRKGLITTVLEAESSTSYLQL